MDEVGRIKKPRSDGEATCRSTSCSILVLLRACNVDGLGRSNAGIVVFEKVEVAASQLTKLDSERLRLINHRSTSSFHSLLSLTLGKIQI